MTLTGPFTHFGDAFLISRTSFCRLIRDTPITIEEWKRQKAVQADADAGTLELGFSTFFLNRTNRSGIITGGVVGGQSQTGPWKLDARFNREGLSKRVAKIASYAPRITLYNLDASAFMNGPLKKVLGSALVYIDPPYYGKGKELYEDHYKHGDHENVANLVATIDQKWIVSYDNVHPIRQFYSRFRQQTFDLFYSAQQRYKGTEVMVFCEGLKTPGGVRPWRGTIA